MPTMPCFHLSSFRPFQDGSCGRSGGLLLRGSLGLLLARSLTALPWLRDLIDQ